MGWALCAAGVLKRALLLRLMCAPGPVERMGLHACAPLIWSIPVRDGTFIAHASLVERAARDV